MKQLFKSILPILLCVMCAAAIPAAARKINARSKTGKSQQYKSKKQDKSIREIPQNNLPAFANDSIILAGFDKTADSKIETFFATNNSSHTIRRIDVRIEYFMTDGRQLHAQNHSIECAIPPKETRLLSIPSWDRQKSYYYINSRRPARRQATPFKVRVEITKIEVSI